MYPSQDCLFSKSHEHVKRRKYSVRKAWGGVLLWGVKEEGSRQVWPALIFHAEGPPVQHPSQRAEQWFGGGGGCRKSFTGAGKSVKGWIGIGGSSEKYGKGPGRQLEGRGRTERD